MSSWKAGPDPCGLIQNSVTVMFSSVTSSTGRSIRETLRVPLESLPPEQAATRAATAAIAAIFVPFRVIINSLPWVRFDSHSLLNRPQSHYEPGHSLAGTMRLQALYDSLVSAPPSTYFPALTFATWHSISTLPLTQNPS